MSSQSKGQNPAVSNSLRIEILWQTAAVLEACHLRHSLRPHERRQLLELPDRRSVRDDIRVVAVVGAGASADRYPRAQEVSANLRAVLGDQHTEGDSRYRQRLMGARSDAFESIVAALAATPARASAITEHLAELFGVSRPTTLAYELLAHLLKHRYLDAIINFNFDELLDDSIRTEMGLGEYKFVVSDRSCDGVISDPADPDYLPLYIKPHGTASERESLRFTLESYLDPSAQVPGLLDELFGSGALLVVNVGFGLEDTDFCELLKRPSRISVVDCSYQPLQRSTLATLAHRIEDTLQKGEPESSSEGTCKPRPDVRIATDFGVENEASTTGRRPIPGPDKPRAFRSAYEPEGGPTSPTCFWSGHKFAYYWLDHSWLAQDYVDRWNAESNSGEDSNLDSGEYPKSEATNNTRRSPGLPPHRWPAPGVNPAINDLRRSFVEKALTSSGNPIRFDPGALQLLDLVALLDDRTRPESQIDVVDLNQGDHLATGDPLHFYRLETRHLVVGLYGELTSLKGAAAPDARHYWRERTLLELVMYLIESGGVTTPEDLALSRARRCYERFRNVGGTTLFQDLIEEIGITDGPRGTLYVTRSSPTRQVRKSYSLVDGNRPSSSVDPDRPQVGNSQDRRDWEFIAAGLAPQGDRTELLIARLLSSCPTIDSYRAEIFRDFLAEALPAMSRSLMRDDLIGRDDRLCTGVFRSPIKLHTHTALNAYSRLALKRLNPSDGEQNYDERIDIDDPLNGRAEIWASCSSSLLLNDAFLLADVGRTLAGPSLFRRDLVVRIVASDLEEGTYVAGDNDRSSQVDSAEVADLRKRVEQGIVSHFAGRKTPEVSISIRQMQWWRLNRHLILAIVDGTPVAGIYYARPRLSRSLSPVYLTDPSDLAFLEATFRQTWQEAAGVDAGQCDVRRRLIAR